MGTTTTADQPASRRPFGSVIGGMYDESAERIVAIVKECLTSEWQTTGELADAARRAEQNAGTTNSGWHSWRQWALSACNVLLVRGEVERAPHNPRDIYYSWRTPQHDGADDGACAKWAPGGEYHAQYGGGNR